MGVLGNDQYENAVRKLLDREPTARNLDLLVSMAFNIRDDLERPDDKSVDNSLFENFCYKYITGYVKKNWRNLAIQAATGTGLTKEEQMDEVIGLKACYRRALLFEAPYLVDSFFRFIEIDERPQRQFYAPRARYLKPIINSYQDLYDGKLDLLTVSQPKRTGKEVEVDTLITTPFGPKRIGDLKVGDTVIGRDGKPTMVVGVYPQGRKPVYNVTFSESGKTEQLTTVKAGKNHLWTVRTEEDRYKRTSRVMSTEELMNGRMYRGHDNHNNFSVDYVDPIEYEPKDVRISPWLLGALIGDGCYSTGSIGFANVESDMIDRFGKEIAKYGCRITRSDECSVFCNKGDLVDLLKSYGMDGKRAWEKEIPEDYLLNSVSVRTEVLRGLIDTDGYVDPGYSTIEYSTTSERLAEQVAWLVKSLGGKATIKSRMGKYRVDGVVKETRINYRISICFPSEGIVPVSSEKHLKKYSPKRKHLYHFISKIELTDETADMVCIEVDNDEHLYVIDDNFIPTHNTSSALRLCAMFAGRHPEYGILASGSGSALTSVFFNGILEIFKMPTFLEVFPMANIVKTKADLMEIDLQERHAFSTIQARPIDGAVTGSTEARNLLYLDDTVKNHEEAVNRNRLDFLCEKVFGDIYGRRIPGVTPVLIQGTKYSLYDPITRSQEKAQELGWRWREVAIPALDPVTDESNFECVIDGKRLFTTEVYRAERKLVSEEQWAAEFQQEPFEAKGRMFPERKLNRYINLPVDIDPDAIIAACDTAESGEDNTAFIVAYMYGDDVFIEDVIYDNSPSDIVKPRIANLIIKHRVVSSRFESNNAGSYFCRDVEQLTSDMGYKCSYELKRTISNKITRIEMASSNIKKNFYFKDRSQYETNSDYGMLMKEVTTITRSGKVPHDDGSDCLAQLENFIRDRVGQRVDIIDRRQLGF